MRRSALRRPEGFTERYRIIGKIGEGTYGMVFKAEAYGSSSSSSSGSSSHSRGGSMANGPSSSSSGGGGSGSGGGSGGGGGGGSGGGSGGGDDEEVMTFAIKFVKSHKEGKNDVVLSSATVREIKLLRELHHDNVVHLHDVHVDPRDKTLALVFEYADHDLHDIIKQSKQKPLSEYTKKSLMYQILKGVDYMHDAWVMHRDMKPQNILVVGHGRKRGQVKLADFGLARLYKDPIKALSEVERVVVTLWYRAPELLLGAKHYTKAVDMWAVGCIFAELVNARELFCGKEVEGSNAPFQKDQLDKIFKVLGMPTPQSWEGMDHLPEYQQVVQMGRERKYPAQSELRNAVKFGPGRSGAALYDLIAKLLEFDPEVRITAKDALEHEYFKQIEPEPRDWSFDEPGKEPVSFRTQEVTPVSEDQLPWKTKKDPPPSGATHHHHHSSSSNNNNNNGGGGADGTGNSNARGDSPSHRSERSQHHSSSHDRREGSSRSSRSHHSSSSREPSRGREYESSSRRSGEGSGAGGGNAGASSSSGWRDRSVGRGESSRSTSGGGAPSASGVAATSSAAAGGPSAASNNNNNTSSGGGGGVGSKRPAPAPSDRPSSASRPRSPKQQRRR